jgi:predicted phage terminase large subunit-like protein
VDERRSQLDEKIFSAQYQQCPCQPMGSVIKRDTIRRYDSLPIRTKSHYLIQSWDTAIKADPDSDYSACVTLLVDERGTYYVADVLRDRVLYPELKAHAISQAEKHKPDTILIEEAGLGRTLITDLKAGGLPALGAVSDRQKLARTSIQLEKFANGQVFFPTSETWLGDFESEVFAFPDGANDDQVDALIQGLAYKRPISVFSDEALKGFERFSTALWRSQQWGF